MVRELSLSVQVRHLHLIVGLALAIFVFPRLDRPRPNVLNRVGARPPILLRRTVFERPSDNAQAGHIPVVDRNRPGELRATLFPLRRPSGLADVGNDEGYLAVDTRYGAVARAGSIRPAPSHPWASRASRATASGKKRRAPVGNVGRIEINYLSKTFSIDVPNY